MSIMMMAMIIHVRIVVMMMMKMMMTHAPIPSLSILYKSIAGRYRPVRVADGPITARYRFIKNASLGPDYKLKCTATIL